VTCRTHEIRDAAGNVIGAAHVCSRGERKRPCSLCGALASRQCDAPLFGAKAGKTCDVYLCVRCATRTGPNADLCPAHSSAARRRAAADADAWMAELVAADGPPADAAGARCASCRDTGWVCERHPDRPWEGDGAPGCCSCGAPGMKCQACDPDKVDDVALGDMFPEWPHVDARARARTSDDDVRASGAIGGGVVGLLVGDQSRFTHRAGDPPPWANIKDANPRALPVGADQAVRHVAEAFGLDASDYDVQFDHEQDGPDEQEIARRVQARVSRPRGTTTPGELHGIDPTRAEYRFDRRVTLSRADLAHAQSINTKVDHVRRAGQTRGHTCHWPGCGKQCPPAMWGCREHWYRLPKRLRDKIWNAYRAGQEETLTPSREYLDVAHEVDAWIRQQQRDDDIPF
jgi:hypothetical protein